MTATRDAYDPDRMRGFLTSGDRDWLISRKSVDKRREATQQRYRIRQRTQAAALDFLLLKEHLPADDRVQLTGVDWSASLTFIFRSYLDDIVGIAASSPQQSAPYDLDEAEAEYFEFRLEKALGDALGMDRDEWRSYSIDIDVEINRRDRPDTDEVRHRLESGELSPEEVTNMFRHDEISGETFQELLPELGFSLPNRDAAPDDENVDEE